MTFKDLRKFYEQYQAQELKQQELESSTETSPALLLLYSKLRDKPFWFIGDKETHRAEYKRTKGSKNDCCCFWHQFAPIKHDKPQPCYDYEQNIVNLLEDKTRYLAILKSVGLGISTLCLYWIIWRCVKDDLWSGKTVSIVVGPNMDLALKMIKRIRTLFEEYHGIVIDSKASQITINNVTIEAFPSNHLSSFRSLEKPICTYISEADFFEKSQSNEVRTVAERYIPKSGKDYYIIMESTANMPEYLLDIIWHEENSLYTRLTLPYTVGLDRIYTPEEVEQSRRSPSFQREMECKFLGIIGNVFNSKDIDAALLRGEGYDPDGQINYHTTKILRLIQAGDQVPSAL